MSDLTTLANLKAWLGIPAAVGPDDAVLSRLISAGSDYIETWLNRTILSQTYSEVRDGNGGTRLTFADYPVTAVTSVTVTGRPIPAYTSTSRYGYVFSQTLLTLRGGVYAFDDDQSNVELTYTAGYLTVPPAVEQACIELVALRYKNGRGERLGVTAKSLAGETISFSQRDMSASVQTLLANYKKVISL